MALETFQTAILRLAENNDRHDLYMCELKRKLVPISEGEMNTHDDDRTRTDDCFAAIESKMDILLQKMAAIWTENTALHEAYHPSREETAALKAAVDTLMKKLDKNIATTAPTSPETATSSSAMEELTSQLSHVQHNIQDILDAVRNPPGKRKRRTSDQDNEPMTPTNR
jgi:chromosome segregation ATPase